MKESFAKKKRKTLFYFAFKVVCMLTTVHICSLLVSLFTHSPFELVQGCYAKLAKMKTNLHE